MTTLSSRLRAPVVLEAIRATPGITQKQLLAVMGRRSSKVLVQILQKLEQAGQIRRNPLVAVETKGEP